jgi:restriction system protein
MANSTSNDNLLRIGNPEANWNSAGTRILKYTLEMSHSGLKEHKLISAPEVYILMNKANLQSQKWNEAWKIAKNKMEAIALKDASENNAMLLTKNAEKAMADIGNLLLHTLDIDDTIDWNSLKRKDDFLDKPPTKPSKPRIINYPSEPTTLIPEYTFFEKMIKSKKERKTKEYENRNKTQKERWEAEKLDIDKKNRENDRRFNDDMKNWNIATNGWEKKKEAFYLEREKYNSKIDDMEKNYLEKNTDSIIEYCDMVLNNSVYPDKFPKNFELEYIPDTRILIIEYELPSLDDMPSLKEVKYIASRNELKETYIAETQRAKMYDEAIYKITLRSIHEIFEADTAAAIDAVSFNGWVNAINKATGKEENNCILSIQVKKDEFVNIDLRNVDPKTCFKGLKGIASSKLSSLTPIQPVLQISKTDKRFVESHDVVQSVDSTTNLAAMDWEDFEHLIRELFEKEFATSGGEVKVTQASRDGGVDAVAFDPDPIRGGKIVIQAKRYTNTVDVSAVRDLYGTTMNEGATKGILVTTADFGPDAYEFAKGKPITLLNGSNLLHLLAKHGHHAKIDIKEAKKLLANSK